VSLLQPTEVSNGPAASQAARRERLSAFDLVFLGGLLLVLFWWVYDLHFHWQTSPEYSFGWIVLLLSGYLAWERWPDRPRQDKPSPFWICLVIVLLAAPLVLISELYKTAIARTPASTFTLSVGASLFIGALILYGQGRATLRHFLFPLLFLFVAAPLPKIFWHPIVSGLQGMITEMNVESLKLLGIPAHRAGNVIYLPRCVVGVDEACSGVRSLQSSIMAALFIGNLTLKRFGSQFFFLGAGIGLALLGNFFRSLYLSVTAHQKGTEALQGLHDAAGWSILLFTAGGLIVLAWMAGRVEKRITDHGSRITDHGSRITDHESRIPNPKS
jgi:exosortase